MPSYTSLDELLLKKGRNATSKKLDNNTYAERRGDVIAVRLHATDVVTYLPNGLVVLNTGGWKTVTTKARINDFGPKGVSISSIKGEWRVFTQGWDGGSVPFADGITLAPQADGLYYTPVPGTFPDESQLAQQRTAARKLDKDITAYLAKLKGALEHWKLQLESQGSLNTAGDCWYCIGIITTPDGKQAAGVDHLWQHLRDGYVFPSLVLAAYRAKGYRRPEQTFAAHLSWDDPAFVLKIVKGYLKKTLGASSEPSAATTDALKLERAVNAAVEVLEKPGDFGYFGSDESLWATSAPTWTKHRDSSNEEVANFEVVWNTLAGEFPELVPADLDDEHYPARDYNPPAPGALYVFGAGHWAVGHIDQIVVPVKLHNDTPVGVDNLHPAFLRLMELREAVTAYPLLDGAEPIVARLEDESQLSEARQYLAEGATDEQVRALRDVLLEGHGDWDYVSELETSSWLAAIDALQLTPAAWVERHRSADAASWSPAE